MKKLLAYLLIIISIAAVFSLEGCRILIPGRSRIAFASNCNGNFEIYTMDSDGKNQVNLTNNNSWDWYPSWSPDGSRIAFVSDRSSNWEIYIMGSDGKNQVRLTDNSSWDWSPSWN